MMQFNISGTAQKDKCVKFVDIFRHIKDFTEFVTFTMKETGIYIQGMDAAQVCLYEIMFHESWFNYYDESIGVESSGWYNIDEDFFEQEVSMNVGFLHCILNTRQEHQDIQFTYKGEKVCIEFSSKETLEYDKYFELPTFDIDRTLMEIPEVEYDSDMILATDIFSKITSQLKLFDERVTFKCTEDGIDIEANGVDGHMKVKLPADDLDEYSISESSDLEHTYSLKYVNQMSEFSKVSNDVHINISKEYPMKVSYPLDEEKNSYIRFFLAPTIEE